jgi:uncharacterized membrane protein YedE/YeeE
MMPEPRRRVRCATARGFLDKDFSPWRFTFLGGMALGALGASAMMPEAIVDLPKSFTVGIPLRRRCPPPQQLPWCLLYLPDCQTRLLGVCDSTTAYRLPTITPPHLWQFARGVVGAFLVGLGSALGNGCTSGHGISGNARLAKRSMVYTYAALPSGRVSVTEAAHLPCPVDGLPTLLHARVAW